MDPLNVLAFTYWATDETLHIAADFDFKVNSFNLCISLQNNFHIMNKAEMMNKVLNLLLKEPCRNTVGNMTTIGFLNEVIQQDRIL